MTAGVTEFIVRHGLGPESQDADRLVRELHEDMERGLAGQESALRMIPTYISVDRDLPIGEPVIVIDAGGTNLRVAEVSFGEEGNMKVGHFEKHRMPGIDEELDADAFFSALAGHVKPIAGSSSEIGFCFSYPAEISSERDGKLLRWTKEVKAPGVVGCFVGEGLRKALGGQGAGKNITVLNDTIATLLAGTARSRQPCDSYAGLILGTGTNAAYLEQNRNITKLYAGDAPGSQAVNEESGNFDRMPRGDLDLALDAATADPGKQILEKMLGGRYLGDIMRRAAVAAASEDLLSQACAQAIPGVQAMEPRDMDLFLQENSESALPLPAIGTEDRAVLTAIFRAIIARSAKIAAANISAAAQKAAAGHGGSARVGITIDGSTYYKTTWLRADTERFVAETLGARGVAYELIQVEDAPLVGAAIAGLTH